jgi:hypothetical protein
MLHGGEDGKNREASRRREGKPKGTVGYLSLPRPRSQHEEEEEKHLFIF